MIEAKVIPPRQPVAYKEVAVMPPRAAGEIPQPVTQVTTTQEPEKETPRSVEETQ